MIVQMEIHAADPRAKRTAILLLVAGLILGTTLILFFDRARPEIARWIVADTQQVRFRAGMVLSLVAVVVVGPLIGLAAYLYRLGAASARAERFPPPGAAMLYDTPVVSGRAARGARTSGDRRDTDRCRDRDCGAALDRRVCSTERSLASHCSTSPQGRSRIS